MAGPCCRGSAERRGYNGSIVPLGHRRMQGGSWQCVAFEEQPGAGEAEDDSWDGGDHMPCFPWLKPQPAWGRAVLPGHSH